jgi:hypothetical protein
MPWMPLQENNATEPDEPVSFSQETALGVPRFVVLHHNTSDGEHWDLCLEQDAILATWQLAENPQRLDTDNSQPIAARRIQDHRKLYLDYEGPISNNRGHVTRLDRGTYRLIEQFPTQWHFRLYGHYLNGTYDLIFITQSNWQLRRANQ